MARRRSYQRRWAGLVVLVGLGTCVGGFGYWLAGGLSKGRAVSLTGELETGPGKSALQLVVAPEAQPVKADAPAKATPAPAPVESPKPVAQPPAPPSTQPATASRPAYVVDPKQAADDLQAGLAARTRGELLVARETLNRALHTGLTSQQAAQCREALADIASQTIFARTCLQNDPLVENYSVMAGNSLGRLARRYKVTEEFLAQVNNLTDRRYIREGARLKMVKGPFNASICKAEHLMHVYLQDVYVKTYQVALGAEGRTPTGRWKVSSRQENPGWVDPNTGKRWHPDDPANPIGEYWIGMEGLEGDAVGKFGYGIHGTIEPETVGKDVSLGCVRLRPDDIATVYKLLKPDESYITIGQ